MLTLARCAGIVLVLQSTTLALADRSPVERFGETSRGLLFADPPRDDPDSVEGEDPPEPVVDPSDPGLPPPE